MSFAGRLRMARKERGYSQESLAEKLEVSRQSITKWETGNAFPELQKLLQLSVILDKDLDWMMWDEISQLSSDRGPDETWPHDGVHIYNLRSLERAVRDRRLRGILEVLDGTELAEAVEEEGFRGERRYIVFGGRMYAAGTGIDPSSGEQVELFRELRHSEAEAVLIRHAGEKA